MDYSEVHKENELLETNLLDHLGSITWKERKVMAEKGEELYELRKQLDEITKLQTIVNSRQPDESADAVSRTRSLQYDKDTDIACLTKATRLRLRIEGERDKFSSKNLFNVRRLKTPVGFEFISSSKLLPASVMLIQPDTDDQHHNDNNQEKETTIATQQGPTSTHNYLKDASSMHHVLRPVTACHTNKQKPGMLLPPRSKSAVQRSRSRRELEILSRLTPGEKEPVITSDFKVDWTVDRKKQRSRDLQHLRLENQDLQEKIQIFMKNLEKYRRLSLFSKTAEFLHINNNSHLSHISDR